MTLPASSSRRAASVARSPGRRPTRARSRPSTPGTTWTRQTTGSNPRRRAVSVVVPVSLGGQGAGGRIEAGDASCRPAPRRCALRGSASSPPPRRPRVNCRVARSGIWIGSARGLGVTTSACGSRCTSRPVRRSWPKPSSDDLGLARLPAPARCRRARPRPRRCRPSATAWRRASAPIALRRDTARAGCPPLPGRARRCAPTSANSACSTSTGTVAMSRPPVVAWTMLLPGRHADHEARRCRPPRPRA